MTRVESFIWWCTHVFRDIHYIQVAMASCFGLPHQILSFPLNSSHPSTIFISTTYLRDRIKNFSLVPGISDESERLQLNPASLELLRGHSWIIVHQFPGYRIPGSFKYGRIIRKCFGRFSVPGQWQGFQSWVI